MNDTEQSGTVTAPSLPYATFLRISMQALALRSARWVTLAMSFGLFVAAVWWPDWKRTAAAGLFTVLVHLPLWFKRERA